MWAPVNNQSNINTVICLENRVENGWDFGQCYTVAKASKVYIYILTQNGLVSSKKIIINKINGGWCVPECRVCYTQLLHIYIYLLIVINEIKKKVHRALGS